MPVVNKARISVPVVQPMAAAPEPIQSPLPAHLEQDFGVTYLFKRSMAFILDTLLNVGICAAAFSTVLWKQEVAPELLLNPSVIFVAALFMTIFNWALITAQEVAFETSIGKRVFGLGLHGSASTIFFRSLLFFPSVAFFGLGLFWALLDPKKRCWHDLVVHIQPVEIARL
jgi:uncharacterized RDD family membrane protein YckC